MLARNSDLQGVIQSVREIEDRFNKEYRYPWVFLNEEPFTPEFIEYAHSGLKSLMKCANLRLK